MFTKLRQFISHGIPTDQLHVVDETVAVLPGLLGVAVQGPSLDILYKSISVQRYDIIVQ